MLSVAAAGIAWAALGDWNSDNDDAVVADSGKPNTTPEDNAAATDSDSVNPEDQDKSEAPSSANQGVEQNSDEDKDQEPQAAIGEHCGTDDSLTAYEVGVSYIEAYRGSAWRPDVDA